MTAARVLNRTETESSAAGAGEPSLCPVPQQSPDGCRKSRFLHSPLQRSPLLSRGSDWELRPDARERQGEEDLGLGIAVKTQMEAMPFSLPRTHVAPV